MSPLTTNRPQAAERGIALILALFFAIIALGMAISGAVFMNAHRNATRNLFAGHGQALEFARSGLVEAIGWFRKQTSQPVTLFQPILDESLSPPILDTIDQEVGIVREFAISGSLWGRYEVWRDWPADPDAERLEFRNFARCEDISAERGNLSPGSVWRLRSVGYVFRRADESVPFNQLPNRVVAKEMVDTEIRRLALQPPSQAALCTRLATGCRVLTRGRVLGGALGAGVYHQSGSGSVTISGTGAQVTGVPPVANGPYADDFVAVFGVTLTELKGMADEVIGTATDFPSPIPKETLVVCETSMVFTAAQPLAGTGIVVIDGDCTISPATYSSFSGLLYVRGNLVLREPAELQGSMVVTGSATVEGASDYANITFDDGILARLRQVLGTYRQSSSMTRTHHEDDR